MSLALLRGLLVVVAGERLASASGAVKVAEANQRPSMRNFDADFLARYETRNWIYYYQKRWRELLTATFKILRAEFGLSVLHTLQAGYWFVRGEMAFAPKDNDIPLAEAYMRKFYTLLRRLEHDRFDPGRVAQLDVHWWVVHRELAIGSVADKKPLEDALAAYYAALYSVDQEKVREAAHYRAEAMVYCDDWVRQGRQSGHPLLKEVAITLRKCYHALRAAVGTERTISVD